MHAAGERAGGVPRNPDESLIEHVTASLSPEAQGKAIAKAFDNACE